MCFRHTLLFAQAKRRYPLCSIVVVSTLFASHIGVEGFHYDFIIIDLHVAVKRYVVVGQSGGFLLQPVDELGQQSLEFRGAPVIVFP